MYCSKCGVENPEGAKFCRNCGEMLTEKNQTVEEPVKEAVFEETLQNNHESNYDHLSDVGNQESTKDDNEIWYCCCCVIAIFVIFAIFSIL